MSSHWIVFFQKFFWTKSWLYSGKIERSTAAFTFCSHISIAFAPDIVWPSVGAVYAQTNYTSIHYHINSQLHNPCPSIYAHTLKKGKRRQKNPSCTVDTPLTDPAGRHVTGRCHYNGAKCVIWFKTLCHRSIRN